MPRQFHQARHSNGVKSWTEFELLGDGCGWGVKAVGGMHDSFLRILKQSFNFCMRLQIDSGFRSREEHRKMGSLMTSLGL